MGYQNLFFPTPPVTLQAAMSDKALKAPETGREEKGQEKKNSKRWILPPFSTDPRNSWHLSKSFLIYL